MTRRWFVFGLAAGSTSIWAADADDSLYDKVHRRLNNDRQLKIQQLKVDVTDGVVTVDGVVRSQKQQEKVAKVAKIKGVKSVVNRVQVVP